MGEMTQQQWREFVMTGTRTGKLAVTRADGRPHVTPVWFALDGEDIMLTTDGNTVKGRALRRDPRVSMSVDDQEAPYSHVIFDGEAVLSEDPGDLRHWATTLGARYMGAERAAEYGGRNSVPGMLLVRIRPSRINAEAAIA
jgi:PPOX class probable F420-dependent enzyme